ncbi:MAG TPA: hypothetical protein VGP72_05520 [Planctomycetota bacterium]|jgi:hypothetical protein
MKQKVTWDRFDEHRSHLFHYTVVQNFSFLHSFRQLCSAIELVALANHYHPDQIKDPERFLSEPRSRPYFLRVADNVSVVLNDQAPICNGQLGKYFEDGWDTSRYTAFLNGMVFLYAGRENGAEGEIYRSFQQKHRQIHGTDCRLIRISIAEFRACNPVIQWRFCKTNSGGGQARGRVLRGPSLFHSLEWFDSVHDLNEVVFAERVKLPRQVHYQRPDYSWGLIEEALNG